MSELFDELKTYLDKDAAYNLAAALISWDMETLAPSESAEKTSAAYGILASEQHKVVVNDRVKELLTLISAEEEQNKLSTNEKAIVRLFKKGFEQTEKIPVDEYQEYSEFAVQAQGIWSQAKQKDDFEMFKPVLAKMLDYQKRFLGYRAKEGENIYDLLLNDHEEGFDTKTLDVFFEKVKNTIVPLVKQIKEKNSEVRSDFIFKKYPVNSQKDFAHFLADYIGFDFNRGVMAESEHPFTTAFHNHDARITNHYYEDSLESAIFSVIHEAGHGIYEQGISDAVTMTPAANISMGMHESQSRFYENIVGRSKAFWKPIYKKLQDTYPENLSDVDLDTFIKAFNRSEPSLIRTESDELTYSLHILIRYEIEKMLFADEITVDELPEVWNSKYEEYLGVRPSNNKEGVLQDVHWALGSFGYFPSYAIGNAIAAQLYYTMLDKLPFEQSLENGDLKQIKNFLNENIHQYGSVKTTGEILQDTTGEPFNADYYVRYLTEKFTKLYNL